MKNRDFFYLQYDKINWPNQDKTKINSWIYKNIIDNYISKKTGSSIKIFDIGFGIGAFMKMLDQTMPEKYSEVLLEGCEPSTKNYNFYKKKPVRAKNGVTVKIKKDDFLGSKTKTKFDFITAIYVFTNFLSKDMGKVTKKIHKMLEKKGKFIMVVADEKYLKNKLNTSKSLFIEKSTVRLGTNKYEEILYYSEIPEIGKIIDFNREEKYYVDLFEKNGFVLNKKKRLDDQGFVCEIFVFEKK